ncbi:hypothetical protein ACTXT7_016466, partial [Hymenolepis weldensis]
MPPTRRKPHSKVVKLLSGTEFTSGLYSPWLCEIRQESLFSFCDLVNRLMKRLEVDPEFFSFFPQSPLTDHLVESKRRQDSFEPAKVTNGSASVICIDNMWHWDPISAVSAYFRSASLMDQVLTRLPCSDEGHTYVDWRQLSKSKDFPSLEMILATTTSSAGRQLLEDLFLCHKQAEETKLIQMALIDVALNLNAPDVDKLMKSTDPFKTIPRSVFNTLCQRKRYDYLPVIELAVAAAQASATENSKGASSTGATTVEGLLRRYENALMLSHCEDAASDTSLLTDDDALKNCRPILLNAIRDASRVMQLAAVQQRMSLPSATSKCPRFPCKTLASIHLLRVGVPDTNIDLEVHNFVFGDPIGKAKQLSNPDDILLVLIRLIWLLPSRGCNPNSKHNASLIEAINNVFDTTISGDALTDSAVGRFLDAYKQESMGRCLLASTYRRHLLPAYRESLRNAGFPQLISPVVQMCRDLAEAHCEPSTASPALQSLRHRSTKSTTSQGDSESNHHDPSLFSNVSKLISMSGIGVGRRVPQPYSPNLIILVVYGTMTWGLGREIVDAVTRNSPEPLEVRCVHSALHGLTLMSDDARCLQTFLAFSLACGLDVVKRVGTGVLHWTQAVERMGIREEKKGARKYIME